MLVLLDENLPHRLRLLITGHEVRTVHFQRWDSLSNGELLNAAEEAGFDVIVTADRGIQYQQNIEGRRIGIVILSSNDVETVAAHVPEIRAAINSVKAGSFVMADIGC